MENDCIFCKIANKEIPSDFVYETENTFVIRDLHPKAKTHLLVIPKEHFATLNDLKDGKIMVELIETVQNVTKKLDIKDYRVQINVGKGAGQEVFHLHLHVLANV